jgi:flagellar biosynthetic protein FliR
VLLALPLITALLVANIALGVLARVAQQLNLFAVGFPVTLALGFLVLLLSLPYIGAAMEGLFTRGFQAMDGHARGGGVRSEPGLRVR